MTLWRHSLATLTLGLLWGAVTPHPAAGLDPELAITQYHSRTWSLDDGLPQSTVEAIAQTPDGYLWLGTFDGLVRFDGIRFVGPEEWTDLPPGPVRSLTTDAEGRLWVAALEGLYRQTGSGFRRATYQGEPVAGARFLAPRADGGVWVGRPTTSLLVGDERGHLIEWSDDHGQSIEGVVAIAERAGQLCFLTRTTLHCRTRGGPEVVTERAQIAPQGSWLGSVVIDREGGQWVGSIGEGVVRIVEGRVVERIDRSKGLEDGTVLALLEDRHGSLWISDGTAGMARYDGETVEHGDQVFLARAWFEDLDGLVWIGTNAAGLKRLSQGGITSFSAPEGLPIPVAHTVLETTDGAIWVGTQGGGLAVIRNGSVAGAYGLEDGLPSLDVMCLAENRAGDLLVGTAEGVVRFRDGVFTPLATERARPTFSLLQDSRGTLWGGFLRELRRYQGERFQPVPWGANTYFAAIVEATDGSIWFGGDRGLLRWREDTGHERLSMEEAEGTAVLALLPDGPDLWVGTAGHGLGHWTAEHGFRALRRAQGLCDDLVYSVLDDGAGHLWMSSNRGIFAVAVEEALAVLAGQAAALQCRLFGLAQGMRQRETSGATQPAGWRASDGALWFPTIDGVVRVDPRSLLAAEPPPPALVEAVRPATGSIGDAGQRVYPPDTRDLEIDYTALRLGAPETLTFRYRLAGLAETWTEAGNRRTAYYPGLGPGRYRFEVAARAGDGPWGEATGLDLVLEPRFVETPLFLALVAGSLLLSAVVGQRLYVARLRRRQRELEAAVGRRTAELEAARTDLEEVNTTLERRVEEGVTALRQADRMAAYGHLVAGVAHELRHPLFAVQTAAHLLVRKLGARPEVADEIALLSQEAGRIETLLEDLLELARPDRPTLVPTDPVAVLTEAVTSYEAASGARSEAPLPVERGVEEPLPMVAGEREKLVRMLLNLLTNARRHGQASRLVLTASAYGPDDRPTVRLSIRDDGVGIAPARQVTLFEPFVSGDGGTGLGLAIVRSIVDAHRGTIRVVSDLGRGTEFVIELPGLAAAATAVG